MDNGSVPAWLKMFSDQTRVLRSFLPHSGYSSFETSKPQSDAILVSMSRRSVWMVVVLARIQSDDRSSPVTSARSFFGDSQIIR